MKRTFALMAWILFAVPASAQEKSPPDDVEMLSNVEYGKGGSRPLKMHILRPKKAPADPMPVLVYIHGGGWRAGSKEAGIGKSLPYVREGYFCATIEYRFSQEAVFPAQIEDCKCAIRYLRSKAKEYNLDPDRIGVWGNSAGGHLVALLGTSGHVKELEGKGGSPGFSSRVQAVADFCGPTDFIKIVGNSDGAKGPVQQLFGGPVSEKKDLALLASPITHITKDAAKFLLVHGDKDTLVPLDQSQLFLDALKKAGVSAELYVAEGRGHGISGPDVDKVVREFFDRTLKRRK